MKLFSRKAKAPVVDLVVNPAPQEVTVLKVVETKPALSPEYKAYMKRRWSGPTA
jgi:hypothetical protein